MGLRAPVNYGCDVEVHCKSAGRDTVGAMAGAVIVVVVMLLLGPVALFAGGALWSAFIGRALDADRRRAGAAADAVEGAGASDR